METTDQEKHIPRKPIQVTYAFYLLLVSGSLGILLGSIYAILNWQEHYSNLVFICWGLTYVIPFWIALKVNAGRNWARWLFAVGVVISLTDIPGQIRGFADYPIQSTLSFISFALVSIAVFLLFQRPANVWFKVKRSYDSIPEESQQAAEATDKSSNEIGFSSSIAQEETPVAEKGESAKVVVESKIRPISNTAKNAKIWLIISQAISVLLLILWFLTLIAAQAAEGLWEIILAFSLLLHPVTATICSIVAWISYARARYRLAAILTSLPLFPFVVLFSLWTYNELVKYL